MLPPAVLLCSKFEFLPGSWRWKMSLHTGRSQCPTEAGCCPESQYTAVKSLGKRGKGGSVRWARHGAFQKAQRRWEEICFTSPGLTANPVTTMAWPENCCLGCEGPCKSHIMTILSREALKNWLDLCTQAICSREKNAPVCWSDWTLNWETGRGAWVAQVVKPPSLIFGSGHDLPL